MNRATRAVGFSAQPGTAGIHDLRALLKRLLRQHGFVCVDARREGVGALGIEAFAGSGQHLASVLQEGRGNANIDAGLGVIWRISVNASPTCLDTGGSTTPRQNVLISLSSKTRRPTFSTPRFRSRAAGLASSRSASIAKLKILLIRLWTRLPAACLPPLTMDSMSSMTSARRRRLCAAQRVGQNLAHGCSFAEKSGGLGSATGDTPGTQNRRLQRNPAERDGTQKPYKHELSEEQARPV